MVSLFFSDIVGYSQMVASDEQHTLNLLSEHDIILKKHIKDYNGIIIKHIGDAIFARFSCPQDAIDSSLKIQNELKSRNQIVPVNDKIMIRIGLHEGEVVEKDGDLFGNEVNLCSRIESSTIPEGIACSDNFFLKVNNVYSRPYGYVKLKNIPKPKLLHRVYVDEAEYSNDSPQDLRNLLKNRNINVVESDDVVVDYKTIAFLPPENIGQKQQDFFCFEFLKQLINDSNKIDLIRAPSITDVAKFSKTNYDIIDISTKLAVDYISEFSILCSEEEFKIHILIKSVLDGSCIYENSFSSSVSEMRIVTGKIIIDIANIFGLSIDKSLQKVFKNKIEVDNEAYKLFLEGKFLSDTMSNPEALNNSISKLKESIKLDDEFPSSHAALGMAYALLGEYEDAEDSFDDALDVAEDLDNIEVNSFIYKYLGIFYKKIKNTNKAIKYFEKSLKLQKEIGDNHEIADIYHDMSGCYGIDGNGEKMLNLIERSQKTYLDLDETIRLGNSYGEMGNAFKNLKKFEEAHNMFNKAKPIFLSEEMYFKYSQVLIIQSEIYIDQENYNYASKNLEEAKEISKNFDIPIMNGRIFHALSRVNYAKKNFDNSEEYLDDAIDIFQDLNNKTQLAGLYMLKCNILIEKEKFRKAEKCLSKAKKYMKRLNDQSLFDSYEKVESLLNSKKN